MAILNMLNFLNFKEIKLLLWQKQDIIILLPGGFQLNSVF